MEVAEKARSADSLNEWNAIQLGDDPICDSSGCNQFKHPDSKVADWPRDYGVPSFGMDR